MALILLTYIQSMRNIQKNNRLDLPKNEMDDIHKDMQRLNIKNRSRFLRAIIACRKQVIGSPEFWSAYNQNLKVS